MTYKIMVGETLYTTESYSDEGVFISFIDKLGKHIKANKNSIRYIRES